MQIANLLSNITKGACYGTTSACLFKNSLFSTLKCGREINAVYASLYQLIELCLATGTGTCVK